MAGDITVNPCCQAWKEKYSKLEEKRNALRKAVNILQPLVEKAQVDNLSLKKAYQEEQVRAEIEKENREKESATRVSLENEVAALKSEIFLLQQKVGPNASDRNEELNLLQVRVSEGENEINWLKELLEKEKLRADSEKKSAEAERKKAVETRKNVKAEKVKDEEVNLLQVRVSEGEKEINWLKELLEKEKLRADSEKKSADSERKKALEARKNVKAEKVKDEEVKLLQVRVSEGEKEIICLKELVEKEKLRAESEKKNAEAEKKKATEAWKYVEAEKGKAGEERRLAQIEGKKAEEYRIQVEALRKEANDAKSMLVSQISKFEGVNKKLEVEKKKTMKRRKCADSKMVKAEQLRKLADANKKKAEEEQSRAECLSQQLEDARRWIEELQKKIDEQKAMSKKKHAELDTMKVEEQRRLAEMNREKCMEEKSRADCLSLQLREASLKIEDLHRQIQDLSSRRKVAEASPISPREDINAEIAKVKILKKELKFEKMRVKHAKRVAKLEKSRTDVLQEELGRLKLEFVQFSRRLNILDKCFSPSMEGIDGLEKTGDLKNMLRLKMKENLCCLEPSQVHLQNETELLKPSCKAVAGSDPLRNGIQRSESLTPLLGGNYGGSVSGIDSEMESLIGGSNRIMLQSSAINSSKTSFSDRQLVGSQEQGAFSATASLKVLEESLNVQQTNSSMSGGDTKMRHNENLAVVAENSVRSHPHIDVIGSVSGHSRKRKRMLDAVESIGFLYTEEKKLHSQIEEKLSFLHGLLVRKIDESLEEGKSAVPNLQGGSYAKHASVYKKRKASHEEKVVMPHFCDHDQSKNMEKLETEVCEDPYVFVKASEPANNLIGTAQGCREGICDYVASGLEERVSFEEEACGDYMKLLDLDNTADEECYRTAMEMPLSPTLPEIGFQGVETFDIDNFEPLVERSSHESLSNKKENLPPSCSFDVINVEINSNKFRCDVSETSHILLPHKGVPLGSFDMLGNNRNGLCDTMPTGKDCVGHSQNSGMEVGMSSIPSSGDEGLKIPFEGEFGYECDSIPKHFVVFSNIKDKSSISRIFRATKTCMDRCFLVTQTEWVVEKILLSLKMEENLLAQEKVCVFFSLLLLNFSVAASAKSGSFLNSYFIPVLDSFAGYISAVISDAEARSVFAELLDELLSLIEDFLLDGRVVITDISSETLLGHDSRINVLLDGANVVFSNRVASADQLVAGSIILASVCAAVDRIALICEVSFNIFCTHKYDTSVLLTILHVFAYLGGQKFFTLRTYSYTMTVLKSIVTFIEKGHLAVAMDSSLSSDCEVRSEFHPCAKCPFSEGAVSVDVVISLLLETLQNYAQSGTMHQDLINSSDSSVLSHVDKTGRSSRHEDVYCVLDVNCDASCCLNRCVVHATRSETVESVTLCQLSDVLSLLELLADNMDWDWICGNVVAPLLKMLESPVAENLSVAIVTLLGQLGRLGVDACGYEDKEVEDLRGKLSAFLFRDTTIRAGLPVQIATVSALLRLLSLDFEKVIQGRVIHPAIASLSVPSDLIRKWFSLLSEEQKAFSFSLLQSACVVTD